MNKIEPSALNQRFRENETSEEKPISPRPSTPGQNGDNVSELDMASGLPFHLQIKRGTIWNAHVFIVNS
jgi:hypothetical protein